MILFGKLRGVLLKKLKQLLGVEELDNKDPQYFQQRNAAAKLAIVQMSETEKAEFDLALERR